VIGPDARLRARLEQARELGFLGPGPIEAHIEHAEGFAAVAERALGRTPRRLGDLGSGAGVPGLVLALRWDATEAALVESSARRAVFLRETVAAVGLADRVEVVEGRAETIARDSRFREAFDVVTARGFGPPAVTAEVAAGFVGPGGVLVVSEAPVPDPSRWPAQIPGALGFSTAEPSAAAGAQFVVLAKTRSAAGAVPRASGRVAKRPLW
jgi:16S rRNA (guanine527-N7)-methyltransferase